MYVIGMEERVEVILSTYWTASRLSNRYKLFVELSTERSSDGQGVWN